MQVISAFTLICIYVYICSFDVFVGKCLKALCKYKVYLLHSVMYLKWGVERLLEIFISLEILTFIFLNK